MECKEGYNSHFVLVNGFEPCELEKEPTGDEIVVFEEGFQLKNILFLT